MKCVAIALIGVLGSATPAFAQQSSPGVTTQPVAPISAPTAPDATTTTSSTTAPNAGSQGQQTSNARPAPDVIKEARRNGYVLKTKSDNYVFCKTDASVGTRFTTEKCLDVDTLALMLQQQERDRDYMRSTIQGLGCTTKTGC